MKEQNIYVLFLTFALQFPYEAVVFGEMRKTT